MSLLKASIKRVLSIAANITFIFSSPLLWGWESSFFFFFYFSLPIMPEGGKKWKAIVSCSSRWERGKWSRAVELSTRPAPGRRCICGELKVTLRCMPLARETCCLDKRDSSHLLSSRGDEGLEVSVEAQRVKLISYTFISLQDESISCSFLLFITLILSILLSR